MYKTNVTRLSFFCTISILNLNHIAHRMNAQFHYLFESNDLEIFYKKTSLCFFFDLLFFYKYSMHHLAQGIVNKLNHQWARCLFMQIFFSSFTIHSTRTRCSWWYFDRACITMLFKNQEYQPFFAEVGETFLMIVVLQLFLNIIGYRDFLVEQKTIWLVCVCLIAYLLSTLGIHFLNKICPD